VEGIDGGHPIRPARLVRFARCARSVARSAYRPRAERPAGCQMPG
jgi:hypothetical protein